MIRKGLLLYFVVKRIEPTPDWPSKSKTLAAIGRPALAEAAADIIPQTEN